MVFKLFMSGKHTEVFALIDDSYVERVCTYKWYLHSQGYAVATKYSKGRSTSIYLHRLIMDAKSGEIIDHVNRNRLDCRCENLRYVTPSENTINSIRDKGKSGFWGVLEENDKYLATVDNKYLGLYATAELAALVRDKYILDSRGSDFAILNFNIDYVNSSPLPESIKRVGNNTGVIGSIVHYPPRSSKKKWRVSYQHVHHGWFLTEEEAEAKLQEVLSSSKVVIV